MQLFSKALPLLIIFTLSLFVTLLLSAKGADDIGYSIWRRKSTPEEGFLCVRFALVKSFASINGGLLLASPLVAFVMPVVFRITLTQDAALAVAVTCMIVVGVMIGEFQNLVRRSQGRTRRPSIDFDLLRHNIGCWLGRPDQ